MVKAVSPCIPSLCALQDVQAAAHAGGRGTLDAAVLHCESVWAAGVGRGWQHGGTGWAVGSPTIPQAACPEEKSGRDSRAGTPMQQSL